MEKLNKTGRIFFCIGLAGMVFPQFFYKQFGNNFFPAWPGFPGVAFLSAFFSTITIVACIAIAAGKNGRNISLVLGGLLLAMYIFGYIPYELIVAPYADHLGTWGDGLKEPALAGGLFVIAGTFPLEINFKRAPLIRWLEKLIPCGPLFFCITMVLYGLSHILYTKYISPLVPGWMPGGPTFWTYFAGIALMGSGLAIALNIKRKLAAMLLGIMIFIWLFMVHIPFVIADPYGGNSNSIVSAFSALAFSGIAFVIASAQYVSSKKVAES